jgi:cardiolipin synthase
MSLWIGPFFLASGNWSVLAALLGANYLLAIASAIREVTNSRTSQGSIAWIITLVLLPVPTTFLYLVFGWKLFDAYALVQTHSGRRARADRAREHGIADLRSEHDWPVLAEVAQLPFLAGNSAKLLVDGHATFESIFAGIKRARSYILVQFYIIRDDRLGRQLADLLIERAQAGVSVRVLYDDVGSAWLPRAYVQRLRKAGVSISGFNQRHRFLRLYGPTRINYRSHRKIVVVDGMEGWVGGHNVGVEYLGEDPHFGHWRDTHVRVAGPAALALALVFREDWEWATGERLPARLPDEIPMPGGQPVLVMPTGPADEIASCAIAFTEVIARARKRLWIVSPYFVPDLSMETALFAAQMRGVDVRILIPEKPDHRIVWLASIAYANRMVHHGVDIYRYPGGFLHQKVILVDDKIAGVGTVNFDNRSFRINFEITMWFTGDKMIKDVEKMLRRDFNDANKIERVVPGSSGVVMRFLAQSARLLSPIL